MGTQLKKRVFLGEQVSAKTMDKQDLCKLSLEGWLWIFEVDRVGEGPTLQKGNYA